MLLLLLLYLCAGTYAIYKVHIVHIYLVFFLHDNNNKNFSSSSPFFGKKFHSFVYTAQIHTVHFFLDFQTEIFSLKMLSSMVSSKCFYSPFSLLSPSFSLHFFLRTRRHNHNSSTHGMIMDGDDYSLRALCM